MSANKKITKKEQYNVLLDLINYAENAGATLDTEATYDDLRTFVNHEIELLDNKAAAAQKRAAEKKVEGDALREEVLNVLSDTNYMTIDQIVTALNNPDVTRNMVTSRLTQLGKLDKVEKDSIAVGAGEGTKSRKVSAYRRKA